MESINKTIRPRNVFSQKLLYISAVKLIRREIHTLLEIIKPYKLKVVLYIGKLWMRFTFTLWSIYKMSKKVCFRD